MDFYQAPSKSYNAYPIKVELDTSSVRLAVPSKAIQSAIAHSRTWALTPIATSPLGQVTSIEVAPPGHPSSFSPVIESTITATDEIVTGFWRRFAIYAAAIICIVEVCACVRQIRRRRSTVPKNAPVKNDVVIGNAVYNFAHAANVFNRVWILLIFELVPWLWISVGQLQTAFLPVMSTRMTDFTQCLFFFVACGLIYFPLHFLDAAQYFCFIGEGFFKDTFRTFAPKQIIHNMANGRPVYIVLFLAILTTIVTKPFSARITPVILPAIATIQLLFIILYSLVSQPRQRTLTALEDEVLVEAMTELATAAKFPLKNIYVSSASLLDADIEEQGVYVCGWPRKTRIVVNKRMLSEFSPEDNLALLSRALGAWKASISIRSFYMSQAFFSNFLFQVVTILNAPSVYRTFGFPAVPQGSVFPGAAGLMIFAVCLARPFAIYYSLIMNAASRKFSFEADKHAAKLGHSSELSNVLAKISAINSKGEASFVDDKLFALLYNSQPQISQRLVWLEDERVKEDAKEGVIRLPIGDGEKC